MISYVRLLNAIQVLIHLLLLHRRTPQSIDLNSIQDKHVYLKIEERKETKLINFVQAPLIYTKAKVVFVIRASFQS